MPLHPDAIGKTERKPGSSHTFFRRNCDTCGRKYLADAYAKNPRYCSRECFGEGLHPLPKTREGYLLCKACGLEKPVDAFGLFKSAKSGRRSKCKECVAAEWQATKTPEILARNRAITEKWTAENKERARATQRAWREDNPDKVRSHWQKRRAVLAEVASVRYTKADEDIKKAYWGDVCWMCGSPEIAHMDHVKPISKGGADMLCNLRPACERCSLKKHAKWPFPTAAFCDPFGLNAD